MRPVHLSDSVDTRRLKVDGTSYTAAAGVTNITSEEVDLQGYDGVRFLIGFGAIVAGAATSVKARQGAVTGMSDGADLEGSKQTVADTDDNKVFVIDVYRPQERFVDVVTSRATQNATVDFIIAELYHARKEPITNHSTVGGLEKHASPAEGTA